MIRRLFFRTSLCLWFWEIRSSDPFQHSIVLGARPKGWLCLRPLCRAVACSASLPLAWPCGALPCLAMSRLALPCLASSPLSRLALLGFALQCSSALPAPLAWLRLASSFLSLCCLVLVFALSLPCLASHCLPRPAPPCLALSCSAIALLVLRCLAPPCFSA